MIGDPFTMVVAIVAIVTIGRVLSSNRKARFRSRDRANEHAMLNNPDTEAMREEIRTLKDRIQVLERIATDNSSAHDINRQIEELRNR